MCSGGLDKVNDPKGKTEGLETVVRCNILQTIRGEHALTFPLFTLRGGDNKGEHGEPFHAEGKDKAYRGRTWRTAFARRGRIRPKCNELGGPFILHGGEAYIMHQEFQVIMLKPLSVQESLLNALTMASNETVLVENAVSNLYYFKFISMGTIHS